MNEMDSTTTTTTTTTNTPPAPPPITITISISYSACWHCRVWTIATLFLVLLYGIIYYSSFMDIIQISLPSIKHSSRNDAHSLIHPQHDNIYHPHHDDNNQIRMTSDAINITSASSSLSSSLSNHHNETSTALATTKAGTNSSSLLPSQSSSSSSSSQPIDKPINLSSSSSSSSSSQSNDKPNKPPSSSSSTSKPRKPLPEDIAHKSGVCGTLKYYHSYLARAAYTWSGQLDNPQFLNFECSNNMCRGWADIVSGLMSIYMVAILSGRTVQINWPLVTNLTHTSTPILEFAGFNYTHHYQSLFTRDKDYHGNKYNDTIIKQNLQLYNSRKNLRIGQFNYIGNTPLKEIVDFKRHFNKVHSHILSSDKNTRGVLYTLFTPTYFTTSYSLLMSYQSLRPTSIQFLANLTQQYASNHTHHNDTIIREVYPVIENMIYNPSSSSSFTTPNVLYPSSDEFGLNHTVHIDWYEYIRQDESFQLDNPYLLFSCLYNLMVKPNMKLIQQVYKDTLDFLLNPNYFTIGIQIRVGDKAFKSVDDDNNNEKKDKSNKNNDLPGVDSFNNWFKCAEKIGEDKTKNKDNLPIQFFLITDSYKIRLEAIKKVSSIIVLHSFNRSHHASYIFTNYLTQMYILYTVYCII